jgi:single-strand DNA-binding protein
MNKAILIGRLTKDPELSTTQSGISVCKFTLAIDRPYKNSEGEKEADFLPIIVWRVQAENCGKYLKKGNQCAVSGSVQTRTYDDKDGNKRYITEIVADNVQFLSPRQGGEDTETAREYTPKSASNKKPATVAELTPVDDDDLPF